MLKFLKALSVFAGTIIGVGIFGLPYVALKAGFFVVILYFLLMAGIAILIHLIYGKVALGTEPMHRLSGYAGEYLGLRWKRVAFLVVVFGLNGALLAYLIVGGQFLNSFFSPYFGGSAPIYTFLFWALGTFLIFRGIKSITQIELSLLLVFLGILIVFFIKALPFINADYFQQVDLKFLTFPYGVILFSLWGSALIPEVKEILGNEVKHFKKVIILGILLAIVTYLFFIFVVLGAAGPLTSKEAISGLALVIGNDVIKLGFLFGIITCFTSFITLGLTLKKVFWYDWGISKNLSWFIACFVPLFLFLTGLRQFIDVIGLTGALAIGLEGLIIVFLYRAFLKKKLGRQMNPLLYIVSALFILGIFFEIFYFIFAK